MLALLPLVLPQEPKASLWKAVPAAGEKENAEVIAAGNGRFVVRGAGRPVVRVFEGAVDVAVGLLTPDTILRADRDGTLHFSNDGGVSWRTTAAHPPLSGEVSLALSPDASIWIVSTPTESYRSGDHGARWIPCVGLSERARPVPDATSPDRFYALDPEGTGLQISTNGGRSFKLSGLDLPPEAGKDSFLVSTPGRSGDLWLAGGGGLFHAEPSRGFERVAGIEEVEAVTFERAFAHESSARPFLLGRVGGQSGLYRSEATLAGWSAIPQPTSSMRSIAGDSRRGGRMYARTTEGFRYIDLGVLQNFGLEKSKK